MFNIRYLSLFSGIGAFEKALYLEDVSFDLVGYSEIDKHASKNYSLIHGVSEELNYGDITKIDTNKLPNFDLLTCGFPCVDISVAGKGEGIKKGTRSGLYYEGYRILKAKLPKISIIENVKNLIGKKHIESFKMILSDLEKLGYTNYWQVLNAKDYIIPQNRERVFIISILGEHKPFNFPQKQELKLNLKDMLEDVVDEKYYLKDSIKLLPHQDVSYCIDANYHKGQSIEGFINKKRRQLIQVGKLDIKANDQNKRVYAGEGLSPTLDAMQGGNRQPKIIERTPLKFLNRNGKKTDGDYSFCIDTSHTGGVKEIYEDCMITHNCKISELYNLLLYFNVLCDIIKIKESEFNEEEKRKSNEILQILWGAIGTEGIQWATRGFGCIYKENLLQQNVHEKGIFEDKKDRKQLEQCSCKCQTYKRFNHVEIQMRELWEDWKTRYTPQGFGLSKQQFREFNMFMQKLSQQNSQEKEGLYCVWKAHEGSWILRDALSEIQEIWRSINDEAKESLQGMWRTCECKRIMWQTLSRSKEKGSFRIRRFTPRCCWRLMGFHDEDFDKVREFTSDTQLYKQAGNSIVVNVLQAIIKELKKTGSL